MDKVANLALVESARFVFSSCLFGKSIEYNLRRNEKVKSENFPRILLSSPRSETVIYIWSDDINVIFEIVKKLSEFYTFPTLIKCCTKIENDIFWYTVHLERRDDILARRSQIWTFHDLSVFVDGQVINYLRRVMNLSSTEFTTRVEQQRSLETRIWIFQDWSNVYIKLTC